MGAAIRKVHTAHPSVLVLVITERMDAIWGIDSSVEMVGTVIADFNDDCFVPLAIVDIVNAFADLILQLSDRGR